MSTPADDTGDGPDYWTVNALVQRGRRWAHVTDLAAHNDAKALLREARAEVDSLRVTLEAAAAKRDEWLRTAKSYPYQTMRVGEAHDQLHVILAADPVSLADVRERFCDWCSNAAKGTAVHNDGKRHPSCGADEHGFKDTFIEAVTDHG